MNRHTPEHPYVTAFFPIESRRWLLNYIGVNKQYPPSREDQFTSALAKLRRWSMRWSVGWSRSLRFIPAVRPGIGGAITSDAGNRLEDSSRRAAACSHNPRFGQETSAAAVSVKILNDSMAKYGVGDPRLPTGSFLSRRVIAAAAARGPRRPSTHTPSPC